MRVTLPASLHDIPGHSQRSDASPPYQIHKPRFEVSLLYRLHQPVRRRASASISSDDAVSNMVEPAAGVETKPTQKQWKRRKEQLK
ncbi:hypothetical protein V6N13_038450 [Hibiscus sabdariffa]